MTKSSVKKQRIHLQNQINSWNNKVTTLVDQRNILDAKISELNRKIQLNKDKLADLPVEEEEETEQSSEVNTQ